LYFDPKFRWGFKKYLAIIIQKTNLVSIRKRLKYIDNLILRYTKKESSHLVNYYGRWRQKEIIPKNIFGSPQLYQFENIKLQGVENPDTYLTALYGDYMQLPQEEKRLKHSDVMRYK
jgi:lipopolysaccharide cholinephosphotransferase